MFTEGESMKILKLLSNTLFKYYSLYEIAVTKFVDYNIFTVDPVVN